MKDKFLLATILLFFFFIINFNGYSSSSILEDSSAVERNNQSSFDEILKLTPTKYYQSSIIHNNREVFEEIAPLFEKAKSLPKEEKRQAIAIYKALALRGHLESMEALGNICQERKNFHTALRWYILAFQVNWLATGQHSENILEHFKTLNQRSIVKHSTDVNVFFKHFQKFLQFHPKNQHEALKTLITLDVAYEQQKAEPYLSIDDSITKSRWFNTYYFDRFATPQELYQEGLKYCEENNFERAIALLRQSALPQALFKVAKIYEDGLFGNINGKPDYEEAERIYRSLDIPEAACNLGNLYLRGVAGLKTDRTPNYEEAERLFRLVPEIPTATCNLAYMYHFGMCGLKIDGAPDYEEAAKLYMTSGTPEALCNLGNLYRNGYIGLIGNKPDYETAEKFYLLSNHPNAFWNRGRLYRDGHLKLTDTTDLYEFVANCFREANHDEAKCDLANLYLTGRIGVKNGKCDLEKARELYKTSNTPEAFINRGLMHFQEKDEANNYIKAFISFKASKTLIGKFMQLIILEYQFDTVASLFKQTNKENIIRSICEQLEEDIKIATPDEKEIILGFLAYHVNKDSEKSLIHFNNALALGDHLAQLYIQIMQENIESEKADIFKISPQPPFEFQAEAIASSSESTKEHEALKISTPEEKTDLTTYQSTSVTNCKERSTPYNPKKPPLSRLARIQRIFTKISTRIGSIYRPLNTSERDEPKFIPPLTIKFIDKKVEETYKALDTAKKKELLEYIEAKPYGTEGAGKPEILKGKFKGFKGCISRRINEVDRLVYKVSGEHEILILSCQGHY